MGRDGSWPAPHEAAWPTALPPATTIIVDEPDQSALALLGLYAPECAVHAISPSAGDQGPISSLKFADSSESGGPDFIGLHVPINPLAATHRHSGLGFTGYILVLSDRIGAPDVNPSDRHGGLAHRAVSHPGGRRHRRCHGRRLARTRPARRDLGLHAHRPVATAGPCPRDRSIWRRAASSPASASSHSGSERRSSFPNRVRRNRTRTPVEALRSPMCPSSWRASLACATRRHAPPCRPRGGATPTRTMATRITSSRAVARRPRRPEDERPLNRMAGSTPARSAKRGPGRPGQGE